MERSADTGPNGNGGENKQPPLPEAGLRMCFCLECCLREKMESRQQLPEIAKGEGTEWEVSELSSHGTAVRQP